MHKLGRRKPHREQALDVGAVGSDGTIHDIGSRAAAGVGWMTLQKWAIRVAGFATIAILTRLLTPEDFGTLAAASTVLPFFYILADLGFAAYIVQVERIDRQMLSTAFWFSLAAGVVLCGCLFLLAPLLGSVFGAPGVVPVLRVLSIWVIVTAIGSVPIALLRRQMRFRTLAVQGSVAAVAAQIVAIAMAFGGLGVWALVAQSLVAPLITTIWLWSVVRWHPSFTFSAAEFRLMARFGGQVLGVEFIAMLRAWAEAAVIAGTLGIAALGFMSIAQRFVQIVQDLTGSALVPVTNVAFAKIRDSVPRLRDAYLRALRVTYAALSLPLIVVAVGAPQIIPIVFGHGWDESVPVAQVLALAGTLTVGAWLDHGLFYGLGKPGVWLVYALIVDALTIATTVATVRFGLVAVAWGFLGVAIAATVVRWFLVARVVGCAPRAIAAPFGYLVTVVVCAGAAGWGVERWSEPLAGWASVLLIGLVVLVVHLTVTALIARSTIIEAARIVRRFIPGRRMDASERSRSAS